MFNENPEDAFQGPTIAGLIVRNRVLAGWNGGSWIETIKRHDSYSANIPTIPRALKIGDPNTDNRFHRILAIADNIYNGRETDITKGALWYGRQNEASEDFCNRIIRPTLTTAGGMTVRVHEFVATVGRNSCFK